MPRIVPLYVEITRKFPSKRAFLHSLQSGRQPIKITENRFSKICTGHLQARPDEKRAISSLLRVCIAKLFPDGEGGEP